MDVTNYELMLVSVIGKSDALLSRVEKFIKDAEGTDIKVDKLGKKQLAYPIKKQTEGDFTLLNFGVAGSNLKSIYDKLRLEQEDLLRYLLIKTRAIKVLKKKGILPEVKVEEEQPKVAPKVTVVTKTKTVDNSPLTVDSKKIKSGMKAKKVVKVAKELNKKAAKAKKIIKRKK
jgi:small subunit ribosomal protein S6